jgi:hypothetical protein
MSGRMNLDEHNLDDALNAFFLDTQAAAAEASIAAFVLAQQYDVKVDPVKESKLLARLKRDAGGGRGWMRFFLFPGLLLVMIFFLASIILSGPGSRNLAKGVGQQELLPVILKDTGGATVTPPREGQLTISPKKTSANSIPVVIQTDAPPVFFSQDPVLYGIAPEKPLFNVQELEALAALKKIFLEKLLAFDKDIYTKVVEGTIAYRDEEKPVYPFVMRNQAVTNIEYKIFLADLVRSGNTESLNRALVRTGTWNNYACPLLASGYFQDSKYNDFPVVNVNREGIALYCGWLEKEINQAYLLKHPKADSLKVRLPRDFEWLYAIRSGYSRLPDCSGYNTIYDIGEGLVDHSFLKRLALIRKRDRSKLNYIDGLYNMNRYGMSEKSIRDIFEDGLRYCEDSIAPSESNKVLKYLGKTGHVSELIYDNKGRAIVIGSCWKSKEEYMKMLGEFNAYAASPFVGFRFVITGESKGSPKDPFW